jgi:aldehyde dehydrogenase (NAD(P)+)
MVAERKAFPDTTSRPELDAQLNRLKEAAPAWARSSLDERLTMLRGFLSGFAGLADEFCAAGNRMKGLDPEGPEGAEEWLAGAVVIARNLRLLIATLEKVRAGHQTISSDRIETKPDGRVTARVFPTDGFDKMMMGGFTADVWMKPGVKAAEVINRAAAHYKTPPEQRKPAVSLVLGAGNVSSIPPTDALYKMFAEGKTVILKMNPVNAHVGPFVERAFKAAIDRGILTVCYGAADVGSYLVTHPVVDEIHITGSDKTHDIMVWGPPGPDRDARKKKKEPLLKKDITSELGNVTPVIVVPGPYSDAEIDWQGQSIAGSMANNASFNCNSPKMLVASGAWDGRAKLRDALSRGLEKVPVRKAYYPGAEQRWKELTESHPNVKRIGSTDPGTLPWAIIPDLDASKPDEKCFVMEPWCSVISETTLPAGDAASFLDQAVKFCNERLWGTLACTIVIHPQSLKDPKVAEAFERAIRELRYGTVCINHWAALGFAYGSTPWGGHPSASLEDIQSGRGWVHNTYLLNDDDIEKVVIRGPLVAKPKLPYMVPHKTGHTLARRLFRFEVSPSFLKLPGIVAAALRG